MKILPTEGENPPELYGAITAEASNRVEINSPAAKRVFSMAVTAPGQRDRGRPTSWSSAIDALAAGRLIDSSSEGLVYLDSRRSSNSRLFVVSAGNVEESNIGISPLERSDVDSVHDPGQAWNALTVGAYTNKTDLTDPSFRGWTPVAAAGSLSPWSTTSRTFEAKWPIKPEVLFEGGNVAWNRKDDFAIDVPELNLLTTHHRPIEKQFTTTGMTSAASAQAANMAAHVLAQYPDFWAETVKGLLVHSARWTSVMQKEIDSAQTKKDVIHLLRRYGYGVPQLDRALRSAGDSLTLIAQSTISPYASDTPREMQLFDLPWPISALESLGEQPAKLRVTLSYFVEPNPGRRGWRKRYSYASHGLRFEVKTPTESVEEFRKRINKAALSDDEPRPERIGASSPWLLGPQYRYLGSVHSDILEEPAAQLASRGAIGVFSVGGWWKTQKESDTPRPRVKYALLVSIETQAPELDIWTPVAAQVGLPIPIELTT